MPTPHTPFSADSVRRMLAFLPAFERGEYRSASAAYNETGRDPPNVDAFQAELFASGFWILFGGEDWFRARTTPDPETADLLTLRRLLTFMLQTDRFCGGHLSACCANGDVERILQRLRHLAGGGR